MPNTTLVAGSIEGLITKFEITLEFAVPYPTKLGQMFIHWSDIENN